MVAVLIEGEVGVDRECGSAGTMLGRQLCLQRTCAGGGSYGEDALSTFAVPKVQHKVQSDSQSDVRIGDVMCNEDRRG